MSRTIRSTALRSLAAGALLGGAGLIMPATTQAQSISPERGLLNYSAASAAFGPRHYATWTLGSGYEQAPDGAQALLGRQAAEAAPAFGPSPATAGSEPKRPVDGDRALRSAFSAN
jgi:hypothetical protein